MAGTLAASWVDIGLYARALPLLSLMACVRRFQFEDKMPRRSITDRLAQLDAQRKTLAARLGKQDRANDTRRKVLLGALVLQRLEKSSDPEFSKRLADWLRRELPVFLTRDVDKTLLADLMGPLGKEAAKPLATMASMATTSEDQVAPSPQAAQSPAE